MMKLERVINVFESVTLLVLLLCTDLHVYATNIDVISNCGSSFNVNELGDVYLDLTEKFTNTECEITVEKNEEWDSEYPRLCVKPERFSGCQVRVEVHNIMRIEGYHDKNYSCSTDLDEYCAYVDKLVLVFKSTLSEAYLLDIRLKAYRGKSEYVDDYDYSFPGYLIAIMVVGILLSIGFAVLIIGCRIYRQRQFMSMASRAQQPYPAAQYPAAQYPAAQYQTSPQQAPNVYQGTPGYQAPGSGYGAPTSGYPTSQPTATQQGPQGAGYQPYSQTPYTRHSSEPSAPPDVNVAQPPPSYQQALDMQDKTRT